MYFEYSSTLRKELIPKSVLTQIFSDSAIKLYSAIPEINEFLLNKHIPITLVGSKRIRKINSKFRKKDMSTDVLTFEYHEGDIAGEMFLCIDDIKRNAVRFDHTLVEEFIEIFVHGLLHMSGVEHGEYMFRIQRDITKKILIML